MIITTGFGGVGVVSQEERSRAPTLVRAPRTQLAGVSATGVMRFGVIRADSSVGTLSSYLVDVYGATVASLSEAATQEAQDALQSPATSSFQRGEVVALRRVDGDWRIQKLYGTSLSNLVQAGDLGVRAQSSDVIFDYTDLRDFFLANPAATSAEGIGTYGGYWVYGQFQLASLFPCRHTGLAVTDTIAASISLATRFSVPGPYTVLTASVTWYWSTGESAAWTASTSSGFGAGSLVAAPTGTHPSTVGRAFQGGISITTQALGVTSQVPVGGVAVGFAHVVCTRLAGSVTDGSSTVAWLPTPSTASFTISTAYVPLAVDESFPTSGSVQEGSGTLTLS